MIQVTNISKSFSDLGATDPESQVFVLKNISFEVKAGESVVILGQSGIGKSVLLKIMADLLEPDQGAVKISSDNVGMLFQKNALFDSFTVEQNLDFPLQERTRHGKKKRKELITKFLEWVGLPNTEKQFPDELSGGMQKRLGIARALIVEPDVILYDEPTAGLDPITSRMIADLILRLRKELNTTLVSVTSDVQRAFQLADHVFLLIGSKEGATLLSSGTPEETMKSQNPAIQQFIKGLTQGPLTGGVN